MSVAPLVVLAAVALDTLAGEPRRFHPLNGFGRLANRLEGLLNRPRQRPRPKRLLGILAVALLLLPWVALAGWAGLTPVGPLVDLGLLFLALGGGSLASHARAVARPLEVGEIHRARKKVAQLVSRDAEHLDASGVATAAVESTLENGNDAVFAPIFWYLLLGGTGVVLYRLANTLDALWGYRTLRFRDFGWAAARLDDGLNWAPARLTALTYALLGHTRTALRCWRSQGRAWPSPNAGIVMAAGAGALGFRIGGDTHYGGALRRRPPLGEGDPAVAGDIARAILLMQKGTWLWVGLILAAAGAIGLMAE